MKKIGFLLALVAVIVGSVYAADKRPSTMKIWITPDNTVTDNTSKQGGK